MPMMLPSHVRIVEVGPRDGLQNEAQLVPSEDKIRFIEMLADAGLPVVEATSFVSPKWVPQLADATEVLTAIQRKPGVRYPVLVPNVKGLERALAAGATEIAFFTAASDTFNQRNTNMSIIESLANIQLMTAMAEGCWLRGYVSTAFHCPYEGQITPEAVLPIVDAFLTIGVAEVSVGDTIGWATPGEVEALTLALQPLAGERLAYHFHDTRGTALANVLIAAQMGVTGFDSSAGGLGGCPFAPGAAGNLATEDLVYALHGMGVETGVDLDAVVGASRFIEQKVGHPLASRYLKSRS